MSVSDDLPVDQPQQRAASTGIRLPPSLTLRAVLDGLALDPQGLTWRVECVDAVWWDGNESPWRESWDGAMVVTSEQLRKQAADDRQVINGRFTALRSGSEAAVVEAVDSTFWLVWSDDQGVLDRLRKRFADAEAVLPPSPWRPEG